MFVSSCGHDFRKKSSFKHVKSYCHHCTEFIWSAVYTCRACRFVAHEKCMSDVRSPCTSVASGLVKSPVDHWWGPQKKFKKKYCNVCRRRMDDRIGCRCEVCKYYVHQSCREFSVPDCKQCATYNPYITPEDSGMPLQFHHWREGNISTSAKCAVCSKACGTTECLASLRCAWCCAVVHSNCCQFFDISCDFGALKRLVLPPACVSMPNTALSAGVTLGMQADQANGTGDNDTAEVEDEMPDKGSSSDWAIPIYDGSSRRPCKTVHLPIESTLKEVLVAALEEYHVSVEEASKFVLAVEKGDRTYSVLEDKQKVEDLQLPNKTLPPIVIRAKDGGDQDVVLRVYSGQLIVAADFKTLVVTPVMRAEEVVAASLEKFGLSNVDPKEYSLVEMTLFDGFKERIVESQEVPWQILQNHRKASVRNIMLTRFYLRNQSDEASVLLYVGSLPQQSSSEESWQILRQALGPVLCQHIQEGPTFPQFGCLFMSVSSNDMALQACTVLKKTVLIDQKPLMVMILPEIHQLFVNSDTSPLLVLVNERSGGGQGSGLLTTFRRLLNPHQVFNIAHGGPLPGLYAFRKLNSYRLIICGGDGTVGWVLSMLDELKEYAKCASPPIAVYPIGTGNDLARVLRWGSGYHGEHRGEQPLHMFEYLEEADVISVDRWSVRFFPEGELCPSVSPHLACHTSSVTPSLDVPQDSVSAERSSVCSNSSGPSDEQNMVIAMNNYLGIGIDADIALGFHLRREEAPEKFHSRLHNKGVYVKMSLGKIVQRSGNLCKDLPKVVTLECDGQSVKLPSGLEGIVVLNIQSWAAGCDAWGSDRDERFKPSSLSDGLVEVVGINGVMHMGQIQGGIRSGVRLAQGSSLTITFNSPLPVQVDGEPWLQPASRVRVELGIPATMLRRSKKKHESKDKDHSLH